MSPPPRMLTAFRRSPPFAHPPNYSHTPLFAVTSTVALPLRRFAFYFATLMPPRRCHYAIPDTPLLPPTMLIIYDASHFAAISPPTPRHADTPRYMITLITPLPPYDAADASMPLPIMLSLFRRAAMLLIIADTPPPYVAHAITMLPLRLFAALR